jgi:hypothetical protein
MDNSSKRPPTEAALLRLLQMKRDLLGLKLLYQVVSGLVRQGIDYAPQDPSVVSNGLIDLDALLAHGSLPHQAGANWATCSYLVRRSPFFVANT